MKSLALVVILVTSGIAGAQTPIHALEKGPVLEAFMDGVFATLMEEDHAPGLVCTIVKNGEVIFTKGYGFADIENKRPVDPASTQFEVGSVSKLFTGTAVMQQVEQGKLDLDVDVNAYLKTFKVPDTFTQPITIKNLVTHTPGLDERSIGMCARDAANVQPLGEYLRKNFPPRVRPPGEVLAYSNQGVALAGYIVETVTGQDFAAYAQDHILTPLAMEHSSFRRPEGFQLTLAVPYQFLAGQYEKKPNNYIHNYPAGSLAATGIDMTHFMIAHLNNGEYNGVRILQRETAQRMHAQQFTPDPRMPGVCVSFFEDFKNGHRAIWHDGALRGFASLCYLLPEENAGIFIANNSDAGLACQHAKDRFMDHYFPAKEATVFPAATADFATRMAPFAGAYRPARYAENSIEKLGTLMNANLSVNNDGTVSTDGNPPGIFREVEPYYFKSIDHATPLLFIPAKPGKRAMAVLDIQVMEQLAWWESGSAQVPFLLVALLSLLAAVMLMPLRWLLAKISGRAFPWKSAPIIAAVLWLTFLCNLISIGGLLVTVLGTDAYEFAFGVPESVIAILGIGQLAVGLSVIAALLVPVFWVRRAWNLKTRCWLTFATATTLALVPLMAYWNLIGFHF